MVKKTVFRTKGGVLVTIHALRWDPYRGGKERQKGAAYKLSGGFHGWVWMHQLEAMP